MGIVREWLEYMARDAVDLRTLLRILNHYLATFNIHGYGDLTDRPDHDEHE